MHCLPLLPLTEPEIVLIDTAVNNPNTWAGCMIGHTCHLTSAYCDDHFNTLRIELGSKR